MRAKVFYTTSILFFLFITTGLFSCRPLQDLGRVNYADVYKPVQSFLVLHSSILHYNNDSSVLVLEIPNNQNGFLYDTVHFSIKFLLFETMSSLSAFDSLKTQFWSQLSNKSSLKTINKGYIMIEQTEI